jgi:hypothetical protein
MAGREPEVALFVLLAFSSFYPLQSRVAPLRSGTRASGSGGKNSTRSILTNPLPLCDTLLRFLESQMSLLGHCMDLQELMGIKSA